MSQSLNDILAAAQAAAAAAQASAGVQANTALATVNNGGAVADVAPVQRGKALSLDDISNGGMNVVAWFKANFSGINVGDDGTPQDEIRVRIRKGDIIAAKSVRFGDPARYYKSFDGVTESRTGRPWAVVVAECMRQDPKCRGDYSSVDIPFLLMQDLKGKGGKVLAEAGDRIGYTTSITGFKPFDAFRRAVLGAAVSDDTIVEGIIYHKADQNQKGKWGYISFGEPSGWKVVEEVHAD